MKKFSLRQMIFLALCCDLGLFSKRLIAPAANLITDALHIPGGIGTGFSLMFLVIAAAFIPHAGCGAVMGAVQSVLALAFGMAGSMGALSPIGYIAPGIVIDLILWTARKRALPPESSMPAANGAASMAAAFTANLIVFRLSGFALALYLCVAAASGVICGLLGAKILCRLSPVWNTRKANSHTQAS